MKPSELLSSPEKWCQGSNARDIHGDSCDIFFERAACFCVIGAVLRCWPEDYSRDEDSNAALDLIASRLPEAVGSTGTKLSRWNDTEGRTFDEVRTLLLSVNL